MIALYQNSAKPQEAFAYQSNEDLYMAQLWGCSATEMQSLIFPKDGVYLNIQDKASLYQ